MWRVAGKIFANSRLLWTWRYPVSFFTRLNGIAAFWTREIDDSSRDGPRQRGEGKC
jgi:uncharacterized protein (DUF427 family)